MTKKFFKIRWLVALSVMLLSPILLAASDVTQKFVRLVEGINTYEAQFNQKISDDLGEVVSDMKGEIKVLRPGKFYWKSNPPDSIIVIADGQFLWTYDIELEQVTKQELALALSASPAAILMGSTHQILDDFEVTSVTQKGCGEDKRLCFALKPKKESEMFQDIKVTFDDNELIEVSMNDPLGQHVKTEFSKVKVNGGVQEKTFNFTPPPGVDVIKPGA